MDKVNQEMTKEDVEKAKKALGAGANAPITSPNEPEKDHSKDAEAAS